MKIFISHAVSDKHLATKFVELLQLGIGVLHTDVFFSSTKGSIPNGSSFVQHILKELNSADLVIGLVSRSYFQSHFCLAEAGAAQARKAAGKCEFFSLVIPPVKFSDLDGVLYGVQSGNILERPALAELKDLIQRKLTAQVPGSNVWDQKRDDFLSVASREVSLYEIKESLGRIAVIQYCWSREDGANVKVHSKLRIIFKNQTGKSLMIERATWESGRDGIPPFEQSQHLKWQLKQGDKEEFELEVPADRNFRTWIGLAEHVAAPECLNRCAKRNTGKLHLKLRLRDHQIHHGIRF
jgi:hypothetical protein